MSFLSLNSLKCKNIFLIILVNGNLINLEFNFGPLNYILFDYLQ